jgi:hypothetical protein
MIKVIIIDKFGIKSEIYVRSETEKIRLVKILKKSNPNAVSIQ